ncbi:MAG: MFS transporter [Novosphingobium sp.]|uniref:MFS transporter n=1 Tax=Novosphingobium sp. TaxID=1874826 RepID=UPI0032B97C6F
MAGGTFDQTEAGVDILGPLPMSRLQMAAVAITVGLNGLDGFDVLAISFASPGIASDWQIDRAALGFVLSMELIGMAIGSILLGNLADRIGRRPTMLGCLIVMTLGMALATTAQDVTSLSIWRVLTGLGIGGMLAATNAVAAEFSNARRRSLCLALMVIGYPLGAVIGGAIAAGLLDGGHWRVVFEFGAIVTALFIPLVWLFVPESVDYLAKKQPVNALARVNQTLARMGHRALEVLPKTDSGPAKTSIAALFKPGLVLTTLLVTIAYFGHITTFYFILKWTPKIVADMGFAPGLAAGVLVWANVGGALGGALFGLLTLKFGLKPLTLAALVLSAIMVAAFGRGPDDLTQLAVMAGAAGFFTEAGIVGLYSVLAQVFPTQVRASGTGFAIGVGRGGAALAPILAGLLFQAGYGLQAVAIVMAVGSLIAAGALFFLRQVGTRSPAR